MTGDSWQVTGDTWHVTCDTWHMTQIIVSTLWQSNVHCILQSLLCTDLVLIILIQRNLFVLCRVSDHDCWPWLLIWWMKIGVEKEAWGQTTPTEVKELPREYLDSLEMKDTFKLFSQPSRPILSSRSGYFINYHLNVWPSLSCTTLKYQGFSPLFLHYGIRMIFFIIYKEGYHIQGCRTF